MEDAAIVTMPTFFLRGVSFGSVETPFTVILRNTLLRRRDQAGKLYTSPTLTYKEPLPEQVDDPPCK